LIELLIVVAIIGLLAAMLIPNLLDALSKAKQKRSMADLRTVGTAMMSWLTDQNSAAAAGASTTDVAISDYQPITLTALRDVLVPQYIQTLPVRDGWKHDYDYYLDVNDPRALHVALVRSPGQLGSFEADTYTPGSFDPTDYVQDLVWADGMFVRFPQKTN
jgi:general secretion pathway protein G